jgi:hypothetical protein
MRRLITLVPIVGMTLLVLTAVGGLAQASPPEFLTISVHRPADTWEATGAFTDSGTFLDDPFFFGGRSSTVHAVRTFSGGSGTITARVDGRITPTDDPCIFDVTGTWAILRGTAAYEDLHGAGSDEETFDACAGTLEGIWQGEVHFD